MENASINVGLLIVFLSFTAFSTNKDLPHLNSCYTKIIKLQISVVLHI